jgi:intracellular sulfur oxidation DsrE/DsrF family protein
MNLRAGRRSLFGRGMAFAVAPAPLLASAYAVGHHVAIHVDSDDEKIMIDALAAVGNLTATLTKGEETVRIELVANGKGLTMLRADTSPVGPPIMAFSERYQNLVFSACGATIAILSRREGQDIPLFPFVRVVPAGVARLVELQEKDWAYLKP